MLFAGVGFLLGGIDDLAVDAVYFARYMWRRARGLRDPTAADLPPVTGRFAIFVPTWQEADVIGAMLSTALARFTHPDVRIYVGLYPNDRATIDAAAAVAEGEPRIQLVIGDDPGPTTKAANLNAIWLGLLRDEVANGMRADAIVLHDAEDVVHPDELRVYAAYLREFDAVQLPVAPLPDTGSRYVAGSYIDEFTEAHGKQLVVRQAIGAGLPFAGVGCAIRRDMLGRVADSRGGMPFDAGSLTEDYELGLTIAAMGGRGALAWVTEADRRTPVAVRAYFPATFEAAVRQKARWMIGIAFAGWDRTGWGRPTALAEHWMRMRDRRAPLGVLIVMTAYAAMVLWSLSVVAHALSGRAVSYPSDWVATLLVFNAALLVWRLAMRVAFVGKAEGWREGLRAVPRMAVGNMIALFAAQRALFRYVAMLRGAPTQWDKTVHRFPTEVMR
jgi:adsorption protein B